MEIRFKGITISQLEQLEALEEAMAEFAWNGIRPMLIISFRMSERATSYDKKLGEVGIKLVEEMCGERPPPVSEIARKIMSVVFPQKDESQPQSHQPLSTWHLPPGKITAAGHSHFVLVTKRAQIRL